jgi:hypothetical protein
MRYFTLISLFILLQTTELTAQVNIEGRVLDNATNQQLSGASVYINQSSIGAITRPDGSFRLSGLDAGSYELVVSYVGYERIIYDITVESKDLRFVFRMEPKVAQLRNVLIVSTAIRQRWLEIFRREFLGTSPAAEASLILNEEDIFFARSDDEKLISAFADVPLVVENKALGYRIFFDLLTFEYNTTSDKCSFFGYNHYEDLFEEEERSRKYDIPRLESYRGSTMHFFHALKKNKLSQEGFSIRIIQHASETRKAKKLNPASTTVDTDEVFVAGKTIPAKQKNILFIDTVRQQFYLTWNGALEITYKASTESATYGLVQPGDPQIGNRVGKIAYIFIDKDPVYILDDGMPEDPRSIRFGGTWIRERLANMLPQDYRPYKKSVLDKKRP